MTEFEAETPKSAEQEAIPDYLGQARELVNYAKDPEHTALEVLSRSQNYLADIITKADEGKMIGSNGVYTREKLLDHFKKMQAEFSKPTVEGNPLMRVPSWGGMRYGFSDLLLSPVTGKIFSDAIAETISKYEPSQEVLDLEVVEEFGETGIDGYALDDRDGIFEVAASQAVRRVGEYDDLFDVNKDPFVSVEAAAVRNDDSPEDKLTAQRKAADAADAAQKAYNRPEMK